MTGKISNPHDTFAARQCVGREGLEPKWQKAIDGGYRLRFVMDSGAAKTIVPRDAIPGTKCRNQKEDHFEWHMET